MHPAPAQTISVRWKTLALPLAACLLGNVALAFGPWFVRLTDVGPVAAGFWRIAIATPILLAAATVLGQHPVRQARGLWLVLIVSGLAFAADLASWHVGIHHTRLANATLFGNAATLIFPIYGFLVARAWPTRGQGIALMMAGAGAALLMGRSAQLSPENLLGDLLCLLAGVLYAVYFIVMARARARMAPLPALAVSSAASALPLLVAAILFGERIMPESWGPLLALALLSQVFGQGLMIYSLGHLSPLIIGIALLVQPIVAATVGWVAYDERLGVADFIGAILVAVALVVVLASRAPAGAKLAPDGSEAQKTQP